MNKYIILIITNKMNIQYDKILHNNFEFLFYFVLGSTTFGDKEIQTFDLMIENPCLLPLSYARFDFMFCFLTNIFNKKKLIIKYVSIFIY